MPITGLVADTPLDDWPEPMPVWAAQPWDCSIHHATLFTFLIAAHLVLGSLRLMANFILQNTYFTVDYSENEIADDPAQHKQSHVLELLDAGKWTGNIVALPNNQGTGHTPCMV